MFEESDNIQNLAHAYGERLTLQFCIDQLEKVQNAKTK